MLDLSYIDDIIIDPKFLGLFVPVAVICFFASRWRKSFKGQIAAVVIIVLGLIISFGINIAQIRSEERIKNEIITQVQMKQGIDITSDTAKKVLEAYKNEEDKLIEVTASETGEDVNRLYSVYFRIIDKKLTFYMKVSDAYIPIT